MAGVWIALGIVILGLTLLDAFLAVLNYNEAGIFVNRFVRWEWIAIRAFTRRISRRWRPIVLRQVTGVLIITTLSCWIIGLVLGFTLIYLGLIGFGLFQISHGVTPDFVGAFYLSVGQFSTAGADNISPGGGWVNLVPVAEALLSVVMLSFFITFLSNIYSVIQNLRSLCADFFQVGPGVGSPVEALRPFFPNGRPRGLDLHLTYMVNDFNLYCDSLRQDHAAYHFQSGEDQFSLPYGLYMTSGVIGALQWGLPSGHPATQSPEIVRLIEAFNDFRDSRYRVMGWRAPVAPSPMSQQQFDENEQAYRSHRLDVQLDPWAARFFALNDAMAQLADPSVAVGTEVTGDAPASDPLDAYRRYVEWLAFAYPAQHFVADVGRDLDFQPIYRGEPAVLSPEHPTAAADAGNQEHRRARRGVGAWLRRRQIFLDPGLVRLRGALRTLATVGVAVALAMTAAVAFSLSATVAGALGGLVAMFASAASASGTQDGSTSAMRRFGLIGLVPVAVGVICGVFLPQDSVWTMVGLAIIAALAVWLGRFGPIAAASGGLLFIASFFSVVLAVERSQYVAAFIAAGIGVICAWVASFVPTRSSRAQLRGVTRAFAARTSTLLDAAIDFLSTGTDRALEKRMQADSRALEDTGSHLAALLDPDAPPTGLSGRRTQSLRLRVFEVELAAQALLRSLPSSTDYAVTVDVRSVLAGELVALQRHVGMLDAQVDAEREPTPYVVSVAPATDWPADARAALAGIGELAAALDRLHAAQRADEDVLAGSGRGAEEMLDAHRVSARSDRHAGGDAIELAVTDRRAVQSGLSVGLALFFGGFVSVGAQYWAALPAYQSLAAANGMTWSRNLLRVVSTIAGAAGSFALTLWVNHNPVVAFAVLAVAVFLTAFLRAVASSWTVFWQTVLLATMYDTVSSLNAEAVYVRMAETAIGAVIALVISALVLPTRTRSTIVKRMAQTIGAAMAATHAAFGRLADPASVDASVISELESETDRQLQAIHAAARPVRGGSGSLERGGIETQLISLWALLYYVRRLVRADVGSGVAASIHSDTSSLSPPLNSSLTAAQWQWLDGASRDNFQAVLAVLDERVPSRVHDVRDSTFPVAQNLTQAERELLIDVKRINEVLLAYLDDVTPGPAGFLPH